MAMPEPLTYPRMSGVVALLWKCTVMVMIFQRPEALVRKSVTFATKVLTCAQVASGQLPAARAGTCPNAQAMARVASRQRRMLMRLMAIPSGVVSSIFLLVGPVGVDQREADLEGLRNGIAAQVEAFFHLDVEHQRVALLGPVDKERLIHGRTPAHHVCVTAAVRGGHRAVVSDG